MKNMMKDIKNRIGLTVDIGDDSEKLYAFTKALRYLHQLDNSKDRMKTFIQAYDLANRKKQFTLSNSIDIENLVSNILGTIDVESQFSSDAPEIVDEAFIPNKFTIAFNDYDKKGKKTKFSSKIRDLNKIKQQEFEITNAFRSKPDGSFFPYINTTNIDLLTLQIFNSIDKKNYRYSCFVYAGIQSNVFNADEIQYLRSIIQTRSLPNNRNVDIAKRFKCNFVIKLIDETYDTENQREMRQNIDTRKTKYGWSFNRCIELLLFKSHYMIYKK